MKMNLIDKLRAQGWYLTDEGLKKLTIINNSGTEDINKVISLALNYDFKDIAAGALPSKLDSNGTIRGCIVLQIQKLRNISAPKANEESTTAPRLLQLELSDGVNTVSALELERIANLNLNIPPGTKLFIKSEKITFVNGFAILKASDVQVLGGEVESLVEKWALARQMLKYARNNRRLSGSGGPPPWIAFGKQLDAKKDAPSADKNFKSLQIANDKDKNSKENDEFNASRTQAIAAASKAGQKKIFGGGQQNILDHNVKKVIEKGYSEEEAKQALKINNNNLERTLYNLKRKQNIRSSATENIAKPANVSAAVRVREKGGVSTKEETVTAKPQANVSLFDFLTDKLPASVSDETAVKSASKERVTKGESSLQTHKAKTFNCESNKFENNMSSSFAANRAYNTPRSEQSQTNQTRSHNSNRKQDENNSQLSNRAAKGGERNNSSRTKAQLPNDTKIQNKAPPTHEEKLNVAGGYHNKRNDRSFKKEKDDRQPNDDYSDNKRSKGNKLVEKQNLPARDVGRNGQDVKNSYQQKQMKKSTNFENSLDNLVNSTSKLTIQNSRELSSNALQSSNKRQQNNSGAYINRQAPERFNKPEHSTNNYTHKAPKLIDSQNNSSKSFSHNTKLSAYSPQISNGFAYDPSKIVGFQNKEANEYAINILKSQGVALQQIQQQLNASSQPQQAVPIPQPPPQLTQTQVPNQTSVSVAFIAPHTNVYVAQAQQGCSQFGMLTGENWPWKEGDLCLAKYWDDGNFYDAKITAVSKNTCVVLFLGYGNHEEVLKSDCVPITDTQHLSLAPYQTSIAVPSISQPPPQRSNIHSGVGCGGNQRYRSERQMYVPPPKRTNN